ncbi:TonB-dependent receptor [Flavobacterium daemonense]|uniref:TonB-dependent receptor n=1 Tax=Flavobacterium daemonense TaxID=1393049 RepID=UPI0011852985|nr:TonB-dependent receptor [Flavobacterium daemonense]KAF2335719.1 TonB-dependent receptor [Flavobacterium daemonense]
MKFNLKFLFITLFFCTISIAQNKGTISGVLTDKETNNAALPFANVLIKGTNISANTDIDGKYSLTVNPGNYTIIFSFVGYESVEKPVTVKAGETVTVNQVLSSGSFTLKDVVVKSATVNKEKESALLLEQKNAIEMKQVIGAQELSRKGVSDAAGAVVKTTGVSKQEGVNNVFVRGLGDRYNSTSLNGLPLPSEDPVYKNVSLEFFGANIIKNINVNKTFSADLFGDNAGANIDISSKELDKNSMLSLSARTGINTNANSSNGFAVANGTYSYFGFLQNGRYSPITNLNSYDFQTNFKTDNVSNTINQNFNIIGGGKFNIGKNKLSLFGVAASNNEYFYRKGFIGQATFSGDYTRRDDLDRWDYKSTQTLLGNAKYKFDKGSVSVNSLYIHNNSQYVNKLIGFDDDINGDIGTPGAEKSLVIRQQNDDNNLFSNQLLADYKFSDKISVNVGGVYSKLKGTEPDRKTNTYAFNDANNSYNAASDSAGQTNRYFSTLDENDASAKAEVNYTFNPESGKSPVLTAGGNYRTTDRTFNFTELLYKFGSGPTMDPLNPDLVLNQAGLDSGVFQLNTGRGGADNPNALSPFYYLANRDILAGYLQLLYPVNEKLTVQVGVRSEQIKQTINWDTNLTSSVNDLTVKPSKIDKNFVLPSVNLKYALNEKNAVRFAASETYTMPQFKEMAQFLYSDVNSNEYGNPYLIASTDYNVDLKYDYYLSKKEIISLGGFYKYIQNPISRTQMNSPAIEYSYVNTDKAFVVGAELEVRKTLYSFDSEARSRDFSWGLNTSYLYSEQTQNNQTTGVISTYFTNAKGKMQGASPLLVNSDLSFSTGNDETSLLSTLVFNYFYDKVYTVGTSLRENTIEKAVPTLDFINNFEFKKYKLGINFGVRNILNARYWLTQQTTSTVTNETKDTLISSYRKGSTIVFGLNWQL